MVGIADATESNILKMIYQAVSWANIAQNGTTPDANTSVALHLSDPGDTGNMDSVPATYTGYVRATVARTSGGWSVSGTAPTVCSPVAAISFGAGTAGSGTVSHFSTGKLGAASDIFFTGTVTPNIVTGNGVTPQLTTATTISLD
jgi:hypothetical protein